MVGQTYRAWDLFHGPHEVPNTHQTLILEVAKADLESFWKFVGLYREHKRQVLAG